MKNSRLFVYAALAVGIAIAWICVAPEPLGASELLGGCPQNCIGTKIVACYEACTGNRATCTWEWRDGTNDCIDLGMHPCSGTHPLCDWLDNWACVP